ncbi:MAG: amidohydrolase [Lentisphaeraceae bacterium]|nr:amidohydrolase [Lentisphaeraceae bacterium]
MKRREFIKASTVIGLSASMASCASEVLAEKIDCHAHLWPKFSGDIPFQPNVKKENVKPESFLAEDLMREGAPFGFSRFVLIQHNFYHGFDPSYLKFAAAKYPGRFAVVGSLDPQDENLDKKMKLDAGTVVSGYRVASKDKKNDWLIGQGHDLMWRSAEEYEQAICLLRNRNVSLQSVLDKCKKFPKTTVVIDHFAHVDFSDIKEREVLWALADLPNVYLKVSKFYGNGRKQPPYLDMLPFVEQVVQHFGSERLMWGSDCPYQLNKPHNYRDSFEIINSKATFLSAKDKENLFVKTAEKVFFRG